MRNLKCYIDVGFTIEEDFSKYTDDEQEKWIENVELMQILFKEDILKQLEHFSQNIRDLKTTITFEGDDSEI